VRVEIVAWVHGFYYFLTGIWPILHMKSFEAFTGPKAERWLVKTVGALILAVSLAILYSAQRGQVPGETWVVAIGSAVALLLVDIVYVADQRIPKVYLLDAAAELILIGLWVSSKPE
jgi:hypothetical protein